jgi:soluble lytic murein transglycosylase
MGLTTLAVASLIFLPQEETVGMMGGTELSHEPAELLVFLTDADEPAGEDALRVLANREDAIGFVASVMLADRLAGEDDGAELLRRALVIHNSKEVRLRLAEQLREKGDIVEATAEYLALLPDMWAMDALLSLNKDKTLILETLVTGEHWQAIVDLLGKAKELPAAETVYLGQALVRLGKHEHGLTVLSELVPVFPADETVLWHYARALEDQGQAEEAMELYRRLGAAGGQRLGRLLEAAGEKEQAAAAYAKSMEPAALWRGAVLWDELGNRQDALTLYLKLTEGSSAYRDDALYRSYLLLKQDDVSRAEALLSELSSHPTWMVRLGLEPAWPHLEDAEAGESALLARIDAYRDVGREDLVSIELDIAWRNGSPEDKISLGERYLKNEDYLLAVRWGTSALRDVPSRHAYELAYPRPFEEEVTAAAAEFNLEPELIWAVMREESRFQPAVASWAGAVGLMQVMPATGEEIAGKLQVEFNRERLTETELNIRFGAFYLRSMLTLFDGDMDRALAAYNGGPGNVRRWLRSELGATSAGFPTAVSFYETRQYITKVRDVYLTYLWLYGES